MGFPLNCRGRCYASQPGSNSGIWRGCRDGDNTGTNRSRFEPNIDIFPDKIAILGTGLPGGCWLLTLRKHWEPTPCSLSTLHAPTALSTHIADTMSEKC